MTGNNQGILVPRPLFLYSDASMATEAARKAAGRFRAGDYLDLSLIGSTHGLSDGFSSLLVPVLALIVADLGLSASRAGLLLSIANVSAFIVIYPVSLLADHGGRRKLILLLGMSLASAGFLLLRWAAGFWAIALLAMAAGAGNAVYHPCGTALAAERFEKRRAFAISFHGLMGNIGASIMPIVQAGIAVASGWRNAIVVCTLPAFVLLPLVGIRFTDVPRLATDRIRGGITKGLREISAIVLKNRVVVLLAVVYALKGMGAKALIGFVPLYGSQVLGMDTRLVGLALTLYFGAGIAAKALMGFLYSKWGPRTALFVPLIVSGTLSFAVGFAPTPLVLLVLLPLAGTVGPISPIILTAASDFSDRRVLASSVGFIYTCYGLGFLSPLAGGWLAEKAGLVMPFLLSAACIWLAAGLSLAMPKRKRIPRR